MTIPQLSIRRLFRGRTGLRASLLCASFACALLDTAESRAQDESSSDVDPKTQVVKHEARLEALEKSLVDQKETFTTVFGWSFGAIAVIFGLSTLMQAMQNRREYELLREQVKRNEEVLGQQDALTEKLQASSLKSIEQVTNFIGSLDAVFHVAQKQDEFASRLQETSRESIEQVTKFIASLDALFQLTHKAKDLEISLKEMQEREARREQAQAIERRNEARELNRQALEICFTLDRENYKAGYHQQRIRSLSEKLGALSDKAQLSSNSRRVLGLDYVVRGMFKEALVELDAAARISKAHAADRASIDLELLYPSMDPSNVHASALREANISLFHRAIVCYNLGDHVAATAQFREAVTYRAQDVQALVYIPESRFLSRQHDFDDVVRAFEETEAKILAVDDTRDWRVPREAHLSLLRIKLGNCFFPGCNHEPYRKRENLRQAEIHYQKALEYIGKVPPGAPGGSPYLAKFSYGHALSLKVNRDIGEAQRREAQQLSQQLLREVIEIVRTKVGEVTEPKIQMTLYYMLALCSKEVGDASMASRYLAEIYERGGKLPPIEGFRIYSPLSKNDLTYLELKRELRQFEERLSNHSRAAAGAAA